MTIKGMADIGISFGFYCQIAFIFVSVLDEGRTLLKGGGRIRPEFAGRGYFEGLRIYSERDIYRCFPEPGPKRSLSTKFWVQSAVERMKRNPKRKLLFKEVGTRCYLKGISTLTRGPGALTLCLN